jgi:hypothetical protein
MIDTLFDTLTVENPLADIAKAHPNLDSASANVKAQDSQPWIDNPRFIESRIASMGRPHAGDENPIPQTSESSLGRVDDSR